MENNCNFAPTNSINDMNLIKENLDRLGKSQQDLATALNVSKVTIGQYVNGNPTLESIQKMAKAIGCKGGDLIDKYEESASTIVPTELKVNINGQEYTYILKQ